MSHSFYPFVENESTTPHVPQAQTPPQVADASHCDKPLVPMYAARIAVFDSSAAAPRVIVIEPCDVRNYLEEITREVTRLSQEVGGTIPFMVIREIVENFIHAYFIEPIISIIDRGQTIRFSDQGPGIKEKEKALDFGTTSATQEMKRYIRGVGSGLPYVNEYMKTTQGYLEVEDNISGGTIVTISALPKPHHKDTLVAPYGQISQMNEGYQPAPLRQNMRDMRGDGFESSARAQAYIKSYRGDSRSYDVAENNHIPAYTRNQDPRGEEIFAQISSKLNERQKNIINAIQAQGSIGPTELTRLFGLSQPTWSRELKTLENLGLIHKNPGEQKRSFTELGSLYISSLE